MADEKPARKAVQKVRLVNGDKRNGAIGAVANVKPDQIAAWEAKGWKRSEEGK